MVSKTIEQIAIQFRQNVRAKAGLETDWDLASEDMKDWYRKLAERSMEKV